MPHAQQQILEAVRNILAAGATAASSRAFLDRADSLQPNELPAILVDEALDGETVTQTTVDSLEQRDLAITVNCVVAGGASAAAQARDLGLQVEKLLTASAQLARLCKYGLRIESSRIVISGEGDRLMASREQSWRMSYAVMAETPETIL